MKAKVLTGGLEALIENPHPMFTGEMIHGSPVLNDDWDRFDHANPSLPLTQQCAEGLIIECNKVWQYNVYKNVWVTIPESEIDYHKGDGYPVRQALQPVAPISEKNEPHFADYQEGDNDEIEDDYIGAIAQYRKDHPENRGIKSEGHDFKLFEQLLNKHGVNNYDIRINAALVEYLGQSRQSQSQQEWIEVDIESENYPASFQDCWLYDISNKVSFGYMIKYGDDISNAEWSFRDGPTEDMPFDFITHYIEVNQPHPPKNPTT